MGRILARLLESVFFGFLLQLSALTWKHECERLLMSERPVMADCNILRRYVSEYFNDRFRQ